MIGNIAKLIIIWLVSFETFGGVVTGTLDKTEGTSDEQFQYTLSIQGSLDEQPDFPAVPGIEVVGTQTSQQTSIINGRYSRELQLIYTLRARSSGSYKIPPIQVKVDGQLEATLPLTLNVKRLTLVERKSRPIYAIQSLGKRDLYQGEATNLKVRLYSRYNLEREPEFRPPSTPDLRLIELQKAPVRKGEMNGKQYLISEIDFLLIPDRTGTVVVPPVQGVAYVASGRGFFSHIQSEVVDANELQIDVKPLPQKGRSKDFSGLVGDFSLDVEVPKKSAAVGDNVVVSFRVEGYGEVKSMAEPNLTFNNTNAFKVYKDKTLHEFEIKDGRYYSRKIFNYAIVPNQQGKISLGEIDVQFFDPEKGVYRNLKADLGSLSVSKGKQQVTVVPNSSQTAVAPVAKKQVQVLGEDILGLHHKDRLTSNSTLSGLQTVLGVALFLLSFILPFLVRIWQLSLSPNSDRLLRKKYKGAYKSFRKAQKEIEAVMVQNPSQGMQLAQDQLRIYLGNKFNLHGLALTEADVQNQLEDKGLSSEIVSNVLQLFRDLDRYRYANQIPKDPRKFLDRTIEVVSRLEEKC